ncbi:MAG: hypothetical protein ABF331_01880 [Hellea sp.]
MSKTLNKNSREGFIIVISLTLMLVMTTMGIGLYYASKKATEQVDIYIGKSDSLYSAEACIAEARLWLKANSATDAPCKNIVPGKICHNVTTGKMSKWKMPNDSQILQNRSAAQSYSCSIALLASVEYEADEVVGFDIGESDSYGDIAGKTKFLYKIRSTGAINEGVNSGLLTLHSSTVEVIDSMIF